LTKSDLTVELIPDADAISDAVSVDNKAVDELENDRLQGGVVRAPQFLDNKTEPVLLLASRLEQHTCTLVII